MIRKLKKILLGNTAFAETADDPLERKQLALAALLIEMARSDFDEQTIESRVIAELLATCFDLSKTEASALIERAGAANSNAVSLFDFTRALHDCLNAEEKCDVIRMLWQVGHADSRIDKYEDYLVHKVADLLYVSHSDVMRLKNEVTDSTIAGK